MVASDKVRETQEGARIALAHDWLVGLRGGEWVLDRLARLFGPTDLYTLVSNSQPITDAISACRVITSPLQRCPGAADKLRRWYLPLMPWAVSRLHVNECDLLFSTSSAVMKSIRPPAGVPHMCYCHSPARYIWEQSDDYAIGAGGGLRRLGLSAVRRRFQSWDRRTADRVTRFLANSSHTAARIERVFDREAHVVHPPARTDYFTPDASVSREDFFLIVGALEPYKRTDLAVQAAETAGFRLKVAGSGSQLESLRANAASNVEFLGRVSDDVLRTLYRSARALIFPQLEDFGIIPVEAQACGCPVIAYGKGGAMDSMTQDTGLLFDEQTVDAIVAAVQSFDDAFYDANQCRRNAERFNPEVFDAAVRKHVQELLKDRS